MSDADSVSVEVGVSRGLNWTLNQMAEYIRALRKRGLEIEETCMGGPIHQIRGLPLVYHKPSHKCPVCYAMDEDVTQ